MASSWNKGTLAEEGSVMSSAVTAFNAGSGAVKAAIDSASRSVQDSNSLYGITETASKALSEAIKIAKDRMAQGVSAVSDVASDVAPMVSQGVEAVSEAATNVDPLGAITEGVQAAGEAVYSKLPSGPEALVKTVLPVVDFASPVLPINAEKFFDFMSNDGQISLTVDDFSSSDVDAVKNAARKVLSEGRNRFTYDDWGFAEKSVLMKDLKTMATGTMTSPEFRMATLIGQTAKGNVFLNDKGELIVKDVYDFNTGPLGTKLQKALVYKEMGDMDNYTKLSQQALSDEEGNPRPFFQRLRIWAAALGAPQGSGTSWEVNFGKLD